MNKKIWLITQDHITAGDIETAILPVDPEQLADSEIFDLHGAVRMRIQGAKGMVDIAANPAARKFFHAMHDRWPWAGFFLQLQPLTAKSSPEEVVDVSVFMSLLLVHVDRLTYCEKPSGITLHYDANQFRRHFAELQSRAAQLAAAVNIPLPIINQRGLLILRSVSSFFNAGQQLNQNRKKQK
jgi:hypothetical protein